MMSEAERPTAKKSTKVSFPVWIFCQENLQEATYSPGSVHAGTVSNEPLSFTL